MKGSWCPSECGETVVGGGKVEDFGNYGGDFESDVGD